MAPSNPDSDVRLRALKNWNATAGPFSSDRTICQLIENQVELTPEAPALIFEGRSLSFRSFNHLANQTARFLSDNYRARSGKTLSADTLIPVVFDRGLEMVVGIHAIMKAGGAYVPIDTDLPRKRLEFILEELDCPMVLTTSHHEDKLRSLGDRCPLVLSLDTARCDINRLSGDNLDSPATPSSLAYMIYTSGSTGEPKGVMIEHQGLVNRIEWMQSAYQLTADRRVIHKTPYSFDVSVWELVWPLAYGAPLVIARPNAHMHMRYLSNMIRENNVTDIHFVPSVLDLFLELNDLESLDSLKHVYCSGEALSPDAVRKFFDAFTNRRLHNLYGPTEASIDVSSWECSSTDPDRFKSIPIGKPIANIQLLVLDEGGAPLGPGEPGDLYISGVGLGRGYFRRPELTSDRFVPNPYSETMHWNSARMYKTGDRAQWMPDGNIQFLGRSDFQVKIHGLRVELGEIETAISRLPNVRSAVIIARHKDGQTSLAAFIESDASIDAKEMKTALTDSLPKYMIPSRFVQVDSMPLTKSGKIDRQALLALVDSH